MQFVPFEQVASVPNIIVDGASTQNTVITLSHWPKSGTRIELKRDTSAEIAFAYLDSSRFHVQVEAVSNNHFDEDGLVGIFTLLDPATAQRHRGLLVDAAQAGDFGFFERRDAARIAFTLSAFADPQTSPLPQGIFDLPYAELAAELYVELLGVLPQLLTNLRDFRALWEREDSELTASEYCLEKGQIVIEERPDLDLAIVRIPQSVVAERVRRFVQPRHVACHPYAIHNRTRCSRLLIVQDRRAELLYRYEGWVQMISRKPAPRVDLSGLASELNEQEQSGGRWIFDGVDQITPKLRLEGSSATSIPPETIERQVEHHLHTGPPAWDPYDDPLDQS